MRSFLLSTALLYFILLTLSCICAKYYFLIVVCFLRVVFVVLRIRPHFCIIDELSDSDVIFHSEEEECFVEYEK